MPERLAGRLSGHKASKVRAEGWRSIKNGKLSDLIEATLAIPAGEDPLPKHGRRLAIVLSPEGDLLIDFAYWTPPEKVTPPGKTTMMGQFEIAPIALMPPSPTLGVPGNALTRFPACTCVRTASWRMELHTKARGDSRVRPHDGGHVPDGRVVDRIAWLLLRDVEWISLTR